MDNPKFWEMSPEARKIVMGRIDPRFTRLSPEAQEIVISRRPPESRRPPGFVDSALTDIGLGFRSGVADVAHTAANIVKPIAPETAQSVEQFAQRQAPTPQELSGREGIGHMILQGVGSVVPEAVKYAPALVAGRFAPLVAGGIEAAGAADKGLVPALKAGAEGAAGFYLMGKAQQFPSRIARAALSGAAMAGPALIESGGDVQKTGAALVTGAAFGALSPQPGKAKPLKFLDAANSAKDDIARAFAPATRSPEPAQTVRIARPHLGEMRQRIDSAEYGLRQARDYFDLTKPDPNLLGMSPEAYKFIENIEGGSIQSVDPKWRPFAQAIREAFDARWQELNREGLINTFVDNYFPHLWKRPDRAQQVYQVIGKRPFEGPKSFLRQRKFASLKEGIDFARQNPQYGLEPATTNPVDMAILKMREMDRLLTARRILKEMRQNGLVREFRPGEKRPNGWIKIDDKVSTVMFRDRRTKLPTIAYELYGPESAVKPINNYLSPGLRSRDWFRAINTVGNSMNQFQLGWSAFHLGFTTNDAIVSNVALGLQKILSGKVGAGLAEFVRAPKVALEPVVQLPLERFFRMRRGFTSQIWEEWMKPGTHPQVAKIVQYMKDAGGGVQMDPFYRTQIWRNMRESFRQGDYLWAALRLPGALTEVASQWIMNDIVPRQKIGAFARLAQFEIEKLGPAANNDMIRGAVQRAWDSVDNRLGQLVYDNLFWNRTAKDLTMMAVRSVGWNLGTFREIGGAGVDLATARARMARGDAFLTPKMAYTTALIMVGGTLGGITNYLLTGERPQGMDYFFPRIGPKDAPGSKDEYGRPERISFPSYIKDIYHWSHAPRRTAEGKLHPLISSFFDMVENKDWQGRQIRNVDDPASQQLLDEVAYLAKQATPFAAKYTMQDWQAQRMGGAPRFTRAERAAAFIGITPAPADIKKSDAEQFLDQKVQETTPAGGRTKGTSVRFDRIREIERAIRQKRDPQPIIDQGMQRGEITEEDVKTAQDRAASDPLVRKFNRAQWQDALKAYEMALSDDRVTREEVSAMRELMQEKIYRNIDRVMALPEKDRDRIRLLSKIARLGFKLGTEGVSTQAPPGTE